VLEEARQAADRTWLALDVIEREVALGGGVELQDARDREPLLERLPDIAAEAVATADPQAVIALERVRRRSD
jgi:hypothetical protein